MPGSGVAQTQADLNQTACGEFEQVDQTLNRVYQQIRRRYQGDSQFLDKLKRSQRAWITFRDAELEALYPDDNKQMHYGSIYPMCVCGEQARLTQDRIEQLRRWLEVEEGDGCAGSRRP
ncbi:MULTISPECIES: lysozyme inhibitor LprI family protein [Thiorhodovibrio]|uniref:lysozyme inhibitor LprI family protein n=1 Tax=Thiorhodovibrio TaxID=61593 RepID=UPI0019137514|nr:MULTISPECIES: lysozyme inhibitor LprI family protein [Thiorhodovibrio]MBK5967507.1 hypothetical protein [Thiorhodovibrio winogradskyi]